MTRQGHSPAAGSNRNLLAGNHGSSWGPNETNNRGGYNEGGIEGERGVTKNRDSEGTEREGRGVGKDPARHHSAIKTRLGYKYMGGGGWRASFLGEIPQGNNRGRLGVMRVVVAVQVARGVR